MYEIKKREVEVVPDKTWFFTKIILIFFGVALLISIIVYGYFSYIHEEEKQNIIDLIEKEDVNSDFNNLFKDKEKKKEEEYGKNIEYEDRNCYIGDVMIKSGDKIKLFSKKIVNRYESCDDYATERLCGDGFLSGDKKFKFALCKVDVDCQLSDGSILKNNQSKKFYSKKVVPYGITCEKYAAHRMCKNTILTGDDRYIYNKCRISYDNSCALPSGNMLANNQSHLFYKKSSVPFGEKCIDYSKRMMCTDSVMQGGDIDEYKYWDCSEISPKDCYIDNTKILHGKIKVLFSKEYGTDYRNCDFYQEFFQCNNGKLNNVDGVYTIDEYHYVKCSDGDGYNE